MLVKLWMNFAMDGTIAKIIQETTTETVMHAEDLDDTY